MSSGWSTISRAAPIVLLAAAQLLAQESAEQTRQLWDSALLARRAAQRAKKPVPAKVERLAQTLVGVTVWRLRRATDADDPATRLSIRGAAGAEEWVPERVSAATQLREGDRIRIGVESARDGFLYVIDREEFAGGKIGPPTLIFPLLRTAGGRNAVAAGRPIEIPAWNDSPSYFTLRRSRPDQVSEVLTVLITPQPMPEVTPAAGPLPLDPARVALWEKQWRARVVRLEAQAPAGAAYGKSERDAAAGLRALTLEDPLPQTMYRVETKPGAPLLIDIPVAIGR